MNAFKRIAFALSIIAATYAPAVAQYQVSNHSVPIGRGSGASGFNSAGPGALDLPLLGSGAADPSFRALTNGSFGSAVPANTYKCNPTGGAGPMLDCAIPSSGGGTITGAACDVTSVTGNTTIGAGSPALTVVGANFQPSDVGKAISVPGAGTGVSTLNASIIARTSTTQVTLNVNAVTALAAVSKTVTYGTDDTAAFQGALSSTTNGSVDFSGAVGCMITDSLSVAINKTITGSPKRSTLYFRQLAGASVKALFEVATSGVYFDGFLANSDNGNSPTAVSGKYIINANGFGVNVNRVGLEGNGSVQRQFIGGVGYYGSNTNISNSTFNGFNTYILSADSAASHVQILNNRATNGPTITNAAGWFSLLSAGISSAMSDVKIIGNSVDMSNLSVANMNTAVYVLGGASSSVYYYDQVVISDNNFLGTSGATASTTGGVISINTKNVTISGNTIKYVGECIGSGGSTSTITGNTLVGCGTYGIEASGTGVTITGNTIDAESQSPFGMSVGNCTYCTITGNVLQALNAPNNYRGMYVYATTGQIAHANIISNNTVITSTQSGISGVYYDCQAGAACTDVSITGNVVRGGAASSYGVRVESSGSSAGYLVGSNTLGQAIGVSVAAGISSLCYVAGQNRSTTKTAGGAFPGLCS